MDTRLLLFALGFFFALSSSAQTGNSIFRTDGNAISQADDCISKCISEASEISSQKEAALKEMKMGFFCSKCNRTQREIEKGGTSFSKHLKDVQGKPIPASPQQLAAKSKEFDDKLNILQTQRTNCENQRSRAIADAERERLDKLRREEEERLAKKRQFEEEQKRIKEESDRKIREQMQATLRDNEKLNGLYRKQMEDRKNLPGLLDGPQAAPNGSAEVKEKTPGDLTAPPPEAAPAASATQSPPQNSQVPQSSDTAEVREPGQLSAYVPVNSGGNYQIPSSVSAVSDNDLQKQNQDFASLIVPDYQNNAPAPPMTVEELRTSYDPKTYQYGATTDDKSDCSQYVNAELKVRGILPEGTEKKNSSQLANYLSDSSSFKKSTSLSDAQANGFLYFEGHIEAIKSVQTDASGNVVEIKTWGCRSQDSHGLHSGCGEGGFSANYLNNKNNVMVFRPK